ncbi:transcriptional repressor, partial [Clostridium sp.]|uniref:transcriptional repressor n=1 Tax=Clostridium sp. TaxID=1506 RepID=UPI003BB004D4
MLKKKGLKVTKHRNSLLEVLEIENQPLTAEDIFLKLKEKGISINLSSVYR